MCSPLNLPIIFSYSDDTMMAIVCLDDSDTHEQELGDGRSVSSSQPSPSTTESLHNTATSSCSGQESNQEQSILSQPSTAESLHGIGTLAKPSASVEEISQKICSLSNGELFIIVQKHQHCRQHLLMDAVEDLVLGG